MCSWCPFLTTEISLKLLWKRSWWTGCALRRNQGRQAQSPLHQAHIHQWPETRKRRNTSSYMIYELLLSEKKTQITPAGISNTSPISFSLYLLKHQLCWNGRTGWQPLGRHKNMKTERARRQNSRGLGLLSNCNLGCCVTMEKAGFSVLQPPHLPSGVEIILQLLGVFLHNTYSAKIKMAGLK